MTLLSQRQRKLMETTKENFRIPQIPVTRGTRIKCTFCKYEYSPKSDRIPKKCGSCGKEKTLMRKTL